MAVLYPQEVIDDYEMSKSVMDTPRPWYQKAIDLVFGRNPAEQFTNSLTALKPGMVIAGVVSPTAVKQLEQKLIEHGKDVYPGRYIPYSWIYGDIDDIKPYAIQPKAYSGLYDPILKTAGIGIPYNPKKDVLFHTQLLSAIKQDQFERAAMRGTNELPPGNYGLPQNALKPRDIDSFVHNRGTFMNTYEHPFEDKALLNYMGSPYPVEWGNPVYGTPEYFKFDRKQRDAVSEAFDFFKRMNLINPAYDMERMTGH